MPTNKPNLMSLAEWKRRTDVAKKVGTGNKERSEALATIDLLLGQYHDDTHGTPSVLVNLKTALDNWYTSKLTKRFWQDDSHLHLSTIRNYDGAVTELKRDVDRAMVLRAPDLWNAAYPGIYIANDIYRGNKWVPTDFAGAISNGLDRIAQRPVGKALLESLSAACVVDQSKKVVIEFGAAMSSAAPVDNITPAERKKVQRTPGDTESFNPQQLLANPRLLATATDTVVDFKREYIGGAGTGCVVTFVHTDTGLDGRPMHIGLAHELVHAYHYLNGMCYRSATGGLADAGNSGIMEEEMRTVGLLAYEDESPSENAIRDEWGITRRTHYLPTISMRNVVATAFT